MQDNNQELMSSTMTTTTMYEQIKPTTSRAPSLQEAINKKYYLQVQVILHEINSTL